MAETENKNTITIEGKEYIFDDLPENARNLVMNIRMADQEIMRARSQLAIAQTARQAYGQGLKQELEGVPEEAKPSKKGAKH